MSRSRVRVGYRRQRARPDQPMVGHCGKRCFTSVAGAREAHRQAGYRVRVYPCETCTAGGRVIYHVTNAEKRRA